jgi:hypothetical protein
MPGGSREARRSIQVRLVRRGADEREFDERFRRDLGPRARLEALWGMVLEAEAWKGRSGCQPRLQRSVLRVERRKRAVGRPQDLLDVEALEDRSDPADGRQ